MEPSQPDRRINPPKRPQHPNIGGRLPSYSPDALNVTFKKGADAAAVLAAIGKQFDIQGATPVFPDKDPGDPLAGLYVVKIKPANLLDALEAFKKHAEVSSASRVAPRRPFSR